MSSEDDEFDYINHNNQELQVPLEPQREPSQLTQSEFLKKEMNPNDELTYSVNQNSLAPRPPMIVHGDDQLTETEPGTDKCFYRDTHLF